MYVAVKGILGNNEYTISDQALLFNIRDLKVDIPGHLKSNPIMW